MRVVSFNANGIRSATRLGFFSWFDSIQADVLCVQELKAQEADIAELLGRSGWHSACCCASRRGYSGCAIWVRHEPLAVTVGMDSSEFDPEGRCVSVRCGDVLIVSAYFPSGTMGDERQAAKYRFLSLMRSRLDGLLACGGQALVCGDFNIAHRKIDIANWRGNLHHTGFLPEERVWMDGLLASGWVDVFRRLDPREGRYTWWSQRGQARARNVGWRIDYQIATPALAARAVRADIYAAQKFSDHAPLVIDYE